MKLYEQIQKTTAFLHSNTRTSPRVGIILGSGLGGLVDVVQAEAVIPYERIPGFPKSTVEGHAGKLIFGLLGAVPVVLMAGRFHYYEGYSMEEVTFPVRVMKALGCETLVVSNAAGGMNPDYQVGDIVLLKDQINLQPVHPLRGANDERLGPRFPDMSEPFHYAFLELAQQIAQEQGLQVHTGVYAGVQGPSFETRAEYHWLRVMGADVVGMSTVPEVLVAVHAGLKVFGASIVTDIGIRETLNKITHEEVLAAAEAAAPRLARLVAALVQRMP